MFDPIVIPCEVRIVPGAAHSTSSRITIVVAGTTVFDEYEHALSAGQRDVIAAIIQGHAAVLAGLVRR